MSNNSRVVEGIIRRYSLSEENNCFSIITQVIIRATAFSTLFICFFFRNIKKSRGAMLKSSASVL